jgi:hypothetical protein
MFELQKYESSALATFLKAEGTSLLAFLLSVLVTYDS